MIADNLNHDRLISCRAHDFAVVPETRGSATGEVYRCRRCHGEADARDVRWFIVGLRQGKAIERRKAEAEARAAVPEPSP